MSDGKMSSSETAYRAVREYQDAQARSDARWGGPSVDSKNSTPAIVWGALFGLVVGAFNIDLDHPVTVVLIPAASMAVGAGVVWVLGKALRFVFATLPRLIFGGAKKIVKGEFREPPA